jgi:hypothetical protein
MKDPSRNEMDELAHFRALVPDRGTARAEEIFRAALTEELSSERKLVSRHRKRSRRLRPAWRLAIAAPLALGLAVGVAVAVQPSGGKPPAALPSLPSSSKPSAVLPSSSQPSAVTTATLLADRAAAAALAGPAVPAGQWIYEQTEHDLPAGLHRLPGGHNRNVQDGWLTADGTMSYGDAGISGNPIYPYSKLGSLPRDPAKLDAYFVSLDPVKTDNKSVVAFSQIESMLFGMVLPPSLEAEMFHALALIPDVRVTDHVKDIAGRAGVAFVLPPTKQSEQLGIILDASDYHLLAQASWGDPSKPSTVHETAILKEYPVAELGSTQPSTIPPSAAELAAERIFFYEEYEYAPPKINHVAPSQWLYRELSTGGKSQEIWATADDSAQAQYVNGTLTVCQRTDSCAASEQWLMPTGPSYSLIYPPYQRPTDSGPLQPVNTQPTLPTLPPLPRPLLDKLNTYSTGCADVAGDCNAVNVAANVLTGYGNYPYLDSSWFLALADVPGVSVQHVTDAAGNQDIAFTFPSQDGVTAILVNATLLKAGTIQYEGYVRDGQQTLVLNQALVSGPGVRP